jgi:hypothetical protein
LTLLASTIFRTAIGNNNLLPGGLVNGGQATVPGVPVGEPAHFQIRVWDNKGGTLNDWASAQAAWLSGATDAGVTPVETSGPLGGFDSTGQPILAPADSGWVSFNIYYIPEPAVLAIVVLGAAGCIIFRKRASSN